MSINIVRGSEADSLLADSRFRAEWSRLCERCLWATSFQGVDFVCTWYRIYRRRFEPILLLSRDQDGALNGLLPLASSEDGELLVAGGTQAEYQAWICPPELSDAFVREAVRSLRREFPGTVLTFLYLPPGTPTAWFRTREATWTCELAAHRRPLLRFGDGSETTRSLGKKSNKSRLKRLEKIGRLEFRRLTDPKEFERLFDDIIHCYDFRQAALHGVAPFRDDDLKKRFHLAMMEMPGLLHVTVLKVGDRLAAAHLGVCGVKEVQLGIIAHNPSLAKNSPGKFHVLLLAQLLRQEGYEQLDLTAGRDAYKERFANGFDEVHVLTVYLSLRQNVVDRLRARVAKAVKTSLRSVGIEPEEVKTLGTKLVHQVCMPAARAKSARRWLGRRHEIRIYSRDTTGVPVSASPRLIRCNSPEHLLRYEPGESDPPLRRFLSTSLHRIEGGLRIYTYAENGSLLCYGWLVERQAKAFLSEVSQELGLPGNSAYLCDFRAFPRGRGGELFATFLRTMLHDAACIPGTVRTFVSVSVDDTTLRDAVEQLGFAYEGSLFEQVRLGRARRWSSVPDLRGGYQDA
jgi:CelD/BcsL family acetyltransferase involved in cellulose biosynthesis